jgi:hypothetical protein
MRRRIRLIVGFDLDDDPADSAHERSRADQIGRNFVHASREEGLLQSAARFLECIPKRSLGGFVHSEISNGGGAGADWIKELPR